MSSLWLFPCFLFIYATSVKHSHQSRPLKPAFIHGEQLFFSNLSVVCRNCRRDIRLRQEHVPQHEAVGGKLLEAGDETGVDIAHNIEKPFIVNLSKQKLKSRSLARSRGHLVDGVVGAKVLHGFADAIVD